jgi:pyruvate/2-oxoglutarate/acetoin dehydrogenase E1 component
MSEIALYQAMKDAISEEMDQDEKVYLIGEDVVGGVYPHTVGLIDKYGTERVIDAPLAENMIVGTSLGAALAGYRPICDMMEADFMQITIDEISKAGQWRFMHGGMPEVPMVIIGGNGGYHGIANDHAKMVYGNLLHIPGIKIAVPSNAYDAKGLLKTAIRDNNPVVYFWHKDSFMEKSEVPEEEYTIPFGEANIVREGSDVTVVAVQKMVSMTEKVAEKLEGRISVEIIDPRTLIPLDMDTILKSVEKTMRLVIVDEANARGSFASELSAQVMEKGFDLLDAPVVRVCGLDYPIPGGFLETVVLPSEERILAGIEEVMAGNL